MKKKSTGSYKLGFSLIECMVYCLVLVIITTFCFNGTAVFTCLCINSAVHINSLSTVYTALDVFTRDLRKAPCTSKSWPILTNTAFIFPLQESEYIGWTYSNNQLVRYQGHYNYDKKKWIKKTKSLVLDAIIEQCGFSFDYLNQDLVAVTIAVKIYGKTINYKHYIG